MSWLGGTGRRSSMPWRMTSAGTILGTTSWSGFYRGKEAVRADLLAAVARSIRRSIHQHGADGLPRSPDDGYQSSQAAARIVATGDEDLALF
jgi:hypothetical protein